MVTIHWIFIGSKRFSHNNKNGLFRMCIFSLLQLICLALICPIHWNAAMISENQRNQRKVKVAFRPWD